MENNQTFYGICNIEVTTAFDEYFAQNIFQIKMHRNRTRRQQLLLEYTCFIIPY